jgi:hypothetical protein
VCFRDNAVLALLRNYTEDRLRGAIAHIPMLAGSQMNIR